MHFSLDNIFNEVMCLQYDSTLGFIRKFIVLLQTERVSRTHCFRKCV